MARGCAFRKGVRLDADGLCALLAGIHGADALAETLKELNGFFAIVCVQDQAAYAAVDRARSMPLFYAARSDGGVLVSDDAFWIQGELGATRRNAVAEEEFLLLGYVTGQDTLCGDIRQIQAGELVRLDVGPRGALAQASFYARYIHHYDAALDAGALAEKLDQALVAMTRRMIEYAAGRRILLPLSGGLDSRLLALLLKRLKYANVAAFSYGSIRSAESRISKAVAEGLGFPWLFVPYSPAAWNKWFHTPEFRAYKHMAFQLSSCAHVQDFPAIWELKKNNAIPADTVIVPGICADLQAGSMSKDHRRDLYCAGPIDRDHVIASIIEQHYNLFDWTARRAELYPQFRARIAEFLGDMAQYPDAASAFETQFCAEKVAKYLVNSVRAYDYWGYDWWLPYWDAEFIGFWETAPLACRIDKALYNGYVSNLQQAILPAPGGKTIGRDRDEWWWTLRRQARRTVLRCCDRWATPLVKKRIIGWHDEFGWFGIMNETQFRRWYTGREFIQSALALEYLGRWKIEP